MSAETITALRELVIALERMDVDDLEAFRLEPGVKLLLEWINQPRQFKWNEVSTDAKPGRYIAVVDRPMLCSWHFATFDGDDWFDLSSGQQIPITHWMPFPAGPSGSKP